MRARWASGSIELSRTLAAQVVRMPSTTRLAAIIAAQSGSSSAMKGRAPEVSSVSSERSTPSFASTGYVARAWPSSSCAIAAAATAASTVGALTAHSP